MSSSSSSSNSSAAATVTSDEFEAIKSVLHSLGIHDYDPLVVVALSEYSRRYASELLCDMKDYSAHANKTEIDMDDMKIATNLSNVKTAGFSPSVATSLEIFHEINKKPLPTISKDTVLHRLPGVAVSAADSKARQYERELDLLVPTFSFVPGVEAYPTVNSIVSRRTMREGSDQPAPSSSAKKSKFVHHSQGSTPIPISLLQMRDRENYKIQERHAESLSKNQRTQLGSKI